MLETAALTLSVANRRPYALKSADYRNVGPLSMAIPRTDEPTARSAVSPRIYRFRMTTEVGLGTFSAQLKLYSHL